MSVDSLQTLLDQLNRGDDKAAEQVFRAYEPYLRKVVRRMLPDHLRPKFDSIDIVQSVWGDVFTVFREGGTSFAGVPQLRAFLVRATRNRFIDRVRQYQTAANREGSGAIELDELPARSQSRPSEAAIANELWEQLLQNCPAEYRPILRLRYAGASPREIAEQVGMHVGSVRRILREMAFRFSCDPLEADEE